MERSSKNKQHAAREWPVFLSAWQERRMHSLAEAVRKLVQPQETAHTSIIKYHYKYLHANSLFHCQYIRWMHFYGFTARVCTLVHFCLCSHIPVRGQSITNNYNIRAMQCWGRLASGTSETGNTIQKVLFVKVQDKERLKNPSRKFIRWGFIIVGA